MIDISKRRLEQQLSDKSKDRGKSHDSVKNELNLIYNDLNENPNIITSQSMNKSKQAAISIATPVPVESYF